MPIYTFFPSRADGASNAFRAVELGGDDAARAFARRVLTEHRSAVEVTIWAGEREVGCIVRASRVLEPAE